MINDEKPIKDEKKLKLATVHELDVISCITLDADKVLNAALGKLKNVTIVGETEEGEFYFAGNRSSGPENVWDLNMGILKLLNITLKADEQ